MSDAAMSLSDAEWLAHRHDETNDRIRFVRVERSFHRQVPFITDPYLGFWAQLRGTGTLGTRGIWANEAFDALGAQLDTASDPQARKKIYQRMMDIVEWEDPGVTVLHQNAVFFGKRDGVKWKPATAFYLDIGPQQLSFDPK